MFNPDCWNVINMCWLQILANLLFLLFITTHFFSLPFFFCFFGRNTHHIPQTRLQQLGHLSSWRSAFKNLTCKQVALTGCQTSYLGKVQEGAVSHSKRQGCTNCSLSSNLAKLNGTFHLSVLLQVLPRKRKSELRSW